MPKNKSKLASPQENKIRRRIRLLFTGFSMGTADLVPGVSGGTIAFLYGIYDELLFSIKVVTGQVPKLLLKGQFKQAWSVIPFGFLIPLVIGIFSAIFGLVHVVTYLLENHPIQIWSVFFGLIIGSVWVIARRVAGWNRNRYSLLLLGFLLTYFVVGLPALNVEPTPLTMLITGAIASCAMILPGISGSLIMVILGQYKHVIQAVEERNLLLLITFTFGALLGLALFARLLSWLLRIHHSALIAFLIGVLIGSLRKVWPWQNEQADGLSVNFVPQLDWLLLVSLVLMAVGFLIVWQLERSGVAKEHVDIQAPKFKEELKAQHD